MVDWIPTTCPNCKRQIGVDTGVTPEGECSYCRQTLVVEDDSIDSETDSSK